MSEKIDYADKIEIARELMLRPLAPCAHPRGHRWVDVNVPPHPERVICYRCGHRRAPR